jgi:hypothetical protein
VAAPAALAGAAARARARRGSARRLAGLVAVLGLLFVVVLVAIFGAVNTLRQQGGGYGPSGLALSDIPRAYLVLYQAAGERYRIDWTVLAAIGSIETDHGRSTAPGVRSGVNSHGCCAGPMQFYVAGRHSTWATYGVDGNGDGRLSPYEPADAIPAAARYLRASGAPRDYRGAIYAYNHADWYVEDVLARAARYRGAARGGQLAIGGANAAAVLRNPHIVLTGVQRADLRRGGIDPRIIGTLEAVGRGHTLVVTALQSDHRPGTNHEAGRAVDIGAVDGETCTGTRTGACGRLDLELAHVRGPMRSTELIYCFDGDLRDPDVFARADHCDHIHVGYDAGR